jgi:hypothetical protein
MRPGLSGLIRVLSMVTMSFSQDRWVNSPRLVRADACAQYGDPFLFSPEPEDRWVNSPRLVQADACAQYGDHFLLSPESDDRWVTVGV